MKIARPYFRYNAKQLEGVITNSGVKEPEVRALLAELQHRRSTPLNETTAAKAEAWLKRNTGKNEESTKTSLQHPETEKVAKVGSPGENSHQLGSNTSALVGSREVSQEKLLEFRPSLLRRVFGAEMIKATNVNGAEVISGSSSNLMLPQPLPLDYTYEVKPALFTTLISITANGQVLQARVGGSQKSLFIEYLNSRRHAPEAKRLDAEFARLMSQDAFLNNRSFRQWASDTEALIEGFPAMKTLEYDWVERLAKSLESATTRRDEHNKAFIAAKKAEFANFFSCAKTWTRSPSCNTVCSSGSNASPKRVIKATLASVFFSINETASPYQPL